LSFELKRRGGDAAFLFCGEARLYARYALAKNLDAVSP
jgi:hypothetical protein